MTTMLALTLNALLAAPTPYGAVPSPRQLLWHESEIIGMVNYSTITYYGREWGYGDEDPARFDPAEFDAAQIVRAAKAGGLQLLVIDAKHHGGFCLWPSRFNDDYTVRNSPWRRGKGDMVRELADACRAEGLRVGIYLSPWDRHHRDYGRPEYVAYYHNQLRELLTDYGTIHEIWFDGANGGDGWYGGAKTTRQIGADYYQWDKVMALVRELQPNAVCFGREDIRWVGNESGVAGDPCWATMNADGGGSLTGGVRGGAVWMPAEADFPQRNGWFWHPGGTTRTAGDLLNHYFATVGRGAVMDLGIAPDRRGLICAEDAASLQGFGDRLRAIFAGDLARGAKVTASNTRAGALVGALTDGDRATWWASDDNQLTPTVTLDFGRPTTFSVVSLREHLPLGLRVDDWALDVWQDGVWRELDSGRGIGARRLWRGQPTITERLRLRITKAAACPVLSEFGVYLEPEASRREMDASLFRRIEQGLPKHTWRVVSASSEGTPGSQAIDGDPATFWHTHTAAGRQAPPQSLVIDLGAEQALGGFLYLPRQDGCAVGNVSAYQIDLSLDGQTWDSVARGEFGNIEANPVQQKVLFAKPARARYLRFTATAAVDGCANVAELGVLGPDAR
ncbi:MAG: discoidin domain-containing protein [Armatimonadetes bacterium]|nr:discoidin domain-containing protein [Armatimonadota bacterium]